MKILPIFIPHEGCLFQCVYCDQGIITKTHNIDYSRIEKTIYDFCYYNDTEKKEIAFYGGTFTSLPEASIYKYLRIVAPYINSRTGLRISTRPDSISNEQLNELAERGLRTVELGIQSFSEKVLSESRRNYTRETAMNACRTVKSIGLNLGVQLMPGLPGSDDETLEKTVSATLEIKPHFVRIYPTIVLKNTVLEKWFLSGKFTPLSLESAIQKAANMIDIFQKNNIKVIKTGLHSGIKHEDIIAGPYHESFGELTRIELIFKKIIANYQKSKTFVISEYDISLFKGFNAKLIRKIKGEFEMKMIPVIIDQKISKGCISFSNRKPQLIW